MLRFENGVIGTIENSRQAVYGYDQRVEVFGSGGAASSGNWHPNAVTISDAAIAFAVTCCWTSSWSGTCESYAAEMIAFVEAISSWRESCARCGQ